MSKARTLAGTVSTGAVLADGTVDASEIGSLTLPTGGDIVGTTATQTLTNKTLTNPIVSLGGTNGTSGQVLTSAGTGAAPTWGTPVSGIVPFVASGSIASAGKVVSLNANGTVSEVAGQSEALSADTAFTTNVGGDKAVAYNTSGSVILMTYKFSLRLFVVAGTVSGTTITWGTPVQVDGSDNPVSMSVQYAPNVDRFFVFYGVGASLKYAAVAVSGTTASVPSGTNLYKSVDVRSDSQKLLYNPNTGALIVYHQENASSAYTQYVTACTISGDTLTRGTERSLSAGLEASITSVGSNRFLICYMSNSPYDARLSIFTNPSGNTSTVAANFTSVSTSAANSCAVHDTFNNVILLFTVYSTKFAYRQVTAISDTAITIGAEVVIPSLAATDSTLTLAVSLYGSRSVAYDSLNRKITVMYRATGGTYPAGGYLVTGEWSSGTFVARPKVQATSVAGDFSHGVCNDLIYTGDVTNKILVVYVNNSASNAPVIRFFTNEASSNINTIGIAQSSATNGQTVQVKLPYQIDTNQTGLTAGAAYYVAGNGTLTTTAATSNFLIGKATSATSLLITKWSQ